MSLAQLALDVARFDAERKRAPLRHWRAWDATLPHTSQLRCLQELQHTRELGVFGGNRSGKTELGRVLLVALVLGSDHPDVAAFWRYHGVDPAMFPPGPAEGMIVALSSGDSIRYHRRQVLDLLPKWGPRHPYSVGVGSNVHHWNLFGRGETYLECMVPGYTKPARITFKTEDQGVESFQGDSVRVVHHDEEGRTQAIYTSASFRLIDEDGWQILTNTPIYGKTWTWDRFERNRPENVRTVRIHAKDNPYLPRARVAAYGDDAVRGKGEFADNEGMVWPMFQDHIHVVPAFTLPSRTTRYRGIDFGTRHPFVCLWGTKLSVTVVLPNGRRLRDGTIVVYAEHYLAGRALPYHVARIREIEGFDRDPTIDRENPKRPHEAWVRGERTVDIAATWTDSEDPQQIMQLNELYGVPASKAHKALASSIDLVGDLLTPDDDGEPRLVFVESCINTVREVRGYHWTTSGNVDGGTKKTPADVDNHCTDALRYLCNGIVRYT